MEFIYKCSECGKQFEMTPDRMVCATCSVQQEPDRPLRGILEVLLTPGADDAPVGALSHLDIFRLLPVAREFFPSIPVGNTPLWAPKRLREELGFPALFLKDDGLNPTGSLKDRASFLVAAYARQHDLRRIVVASTGNAASSMAGVGAAAGLEIVIFVPRTAPRAKLVQSRQYGAVVHLVDGNYDRAYDLSLEFSNEHGGLSRNTAYNPLTIEGKKTAALEMARQLGRIPDHVFVSVGDGVILAGVMKGFRDLVQLGYADRMPTVHAIQAEGSDAITRAWHTGDFAGPIAASTVADSISVDVPRNGRHALRLLREHNGRCVRVSDEAILKAQRRLAATAGLFSEPAGAAALAGFLAVRRDIPPDATVCVLLTGNGLKDIDSALKGLEM